MQAETYLNRPFAEQREQVAPRRTKELLALAFVTVLTGGALFLPPSWDQAFTDICHLAAIFALATITVLWVTRMLGYAGIAVERLLVAIFLAGMPLVYIIAWFQMGRVGAGVAWD